MIIELDDGGTVTFRNGEPRDERPLPKGRLISYAARQGGKQDEFQAATFECPHCLKTVTRRSQCFKTEPDGNGLVVRCPECNEECTL
jgi:hypothetical protein